MKTSNTLRLLTVLALGGNAPAAETPFGWVYTAEVMPRGELELEHQSILRPAGGLSERDHWRHREELEAGIAPHWQLAGYLNWSQDSATRFETLSLEVIRQLRNPDDGSFGLAVYLEPEAGPREQALEWRFMLQKNGADERWIAAANLTGEHAREHKDNGGFESGSALELSAGISYRLAGKLRAGLEGRHESQFEGPAYRQFAKSGSHAGPSLQYEGRGWSTTLAWRRRFSSSNADTARDEYIFKISAALRDED